MIWKPYILAPWLLQTLIWIPTRLALLFFARLKVSGISNIENLDHGVIFAVNHSSELDPILIPASLPFLSHFMPMYYTAREQAFYKNSGWRKYFYGGFFFKLWGAYQVYTGKHDYKLSLVHHLAFLENKLSIIIFPEGRKTRDGKIGEAKGGVAYLSLQTNTPIVPVHIDGVFQMTFFDFLFRRRTIQVVFDKPLYPKDIFPNIEDVVIKEGRNDYKNAARIVMGRVASLTL